MCMVLGSGFSHWWLVELLVRSSDGCEGVLDDVKLEICVQAYTDTGDAKREHYTEL